MKKHAHRQIIQARSPAGLRGKLSVDHLRAIALIHISLVDALVTGTAGLPQLWEWMGTVLTWSKVAQAIQIGEVEIQEIVDLAVVVAARFENTGRIDLDERECDLARTGADVMDLLAEAVDLHTATAIGQWSEQMVAVLRQRPALAA